MQHENDESMIYLKDLLFTVLYRWKTVIAAALILAIALGGVKLFSGLSALKNEEALQNQHKNQAILLEKYEAEKESLEQQADALRQQVDCQNNYLENSIYMQLDPYGFYESTLVLYFDADYQILPSMEFQNVDPTDAVIATYKSILDSEQVQLPLAQHANTALQYIKELISISTDIGTDMLTITLRYPDEAGAKELTKLLTAQLDAIHTQAVKAVTEHEVTVVSQTVGKDMDRSIADAQTAENARMSTLIAELTAMQEKINTLVKPNQQLLDKTTVFKDAIVYGVVGCVLGVFIVAFICLIAHICTDKVYSARTLKNRTRIKILGCISDRKWNPIDRWLRKLEGRNCVDPQVQAHVLAVDILNRCGDVNSLLVTGSTDLEARQQILQALSVAKPGMQIIDAGDILQDVAALEALSGCNAVLLVAQCNVSKYNAVAQQAEWVGDYNKQFIGCVLLGG